MRVWNRVRMWWGRKQFEADLEEEIRIHRQLSGDAAFGSAALVMEQSREVWGLAWLESWNQDVRYALRGLRRSPLFALGVISAIGLGIGLNTTMFSVFNAYVLRPYAVRDPYGLYGFTWRGQTGNAHDFTRAQYEGLRTRDTGFSDVLASMALWAQVDKRVLRGQLVSGNYFSMLGVAMAVGRPLLPWDDGTVLVLGYDAWQSRFGGDAGILGRKVYVRGQPFVVVGVANAAFGGLEDVPDGFWIPLAAAPKLIDGPDPLGSDKAAWLHLIGRVRPGVSPTSVEQRLLAFARPLLPDAAGVTLRQRATTVALTKDTVLTFLPIFTAFGLVLLIACANVSNMMLARALARQREVAIRVSLGASRARLIRQLLTESALLAVPAAATGFLISEVTISAARRILFATMPASFAQMMAVADVNPDGRVFGYILAVSAAAALFFGLAPAVQTTRARIVETNRGDFSSDYRPARLRNLLVAAQVAICTLLLISTAVVLRSEDHVIAQPVGIDTHGLWYVDSTLRYQKLVAERLPGQPGIETVATAFHAPLLGSSQIAVVPSGGDHRTVMRDNFVSSRYFAALRIPLRRGRVFSEAESTAEAPVAIVSESAARRLWPGHDAIGESVAIAPTANPESARYLLPGFTAARVIGVVGEVHSRITRGNDEDTELYFPPHVGPGAAVLVRMSASAADQRRHLEELLDGIAPSLANVVVSMDDTIALRLYPFRVVSWVAGFLAGVALLLTVTGIYGVMAFLVTQRTKEIGIRIALGANAWDVVSIVARQSTTLAGIGAAAGVAMAFVVAPAFAHQIEAIRPYDWVPYVATFCLVVVVATLAALAPAKRAAAIHPVETLRCD